MGKGNVQTRPFIYTAKTLFPFIAHHNNPLANFDILEAKNFMRINVVSLHFDNKLARVILLFQNHDSS